MRIYFSGVAQKDAPERVLRDKKPHVMLTFYDVFQRRRETTDRIKDYLRQRKYEKGGKNHGD